MSGSQAIRRASVWVMGLHTGGCSACAESVAALTAKRYATRLRALGVTFARTPRQSDILLLSGALTPEAQASVEALIEETPHPRALVAVGDCAINGCVFAGSPRLVKPLAQVVNANVEIGGCPPTPQAIIDAIAEARRLLIGAAAPVTPPATTDAKADTEATEAADSPAEPGATQLASLFAAADGDWEEDGASEPADLPNEPNDDSIDSNHLTGPRHGARTSEEKRSE